MKVALLGIPKACNPGIFERLETALRTSTLPAQIVNAKASYRDLTFLMGLTGADAEDARDVSLDHLLRTALAHDGIPYQVLYGSEEECLAQALQVIRRKLASQASADSPKRQESLSIPQEARRWVWSCDKCSDPQCEHLLLSGLLSQRDAAATEPSP